MSAPLLDLFSPDDPDWAAFKDQSPEFLLRAAGDVVRNYCGWHLSPRVHDSVTRPIGSRGIVALPSRYVTSIESVTREDGSIISPNDYWWSEEGWLELCIYCCADRVTIDFAHGYTTLPADIKLIAYELVKAAESNATIPTGGGNIASISSPGGYSVSFNNNSDTNTTTTTLTLSPDQMTNLGNYKLFGLT